MLKPFKIIRYYYRYCTKELKEIFEVLKPLFDRTTNPDLTWHLLYLGIGVITDIAASYLQLMVNFGPAIDLLLLETTTYSLFLSALTVPFLWLFITLIAYNLKEMIMNHIQSEADKILTPKLIQSWFKNKKIQFLKFLKDKNKKSPNHNISEIISYDVSKLIYTVISTFFSFIDCTISFITGTYYLTQLSGTLSFELMGRTIQVPGYMALACFTYAFLRKIISCKINNGLHYAYTRASNLISKLRNRIFTVHENAESIILLHGEHYEEEIIINLQRNHTAAETEIKNKTFWQNMLENFHSNFAYVFGYILTAPQIIDKKLTISSGNDANNYIFRILNFLSWADSNSTQLIKMKDCKDRILSFQKDLDLTDEMLASRKNVEPQYGFNTQGPTLDVQNLSYHKINRDGDVDGEAIHFSQKILPGIIYHVTGPSGYGKSTLFRVLADIWPCIETGKIYFQPGKNKVCFIPQNMYIPPDSTLLQILSYPQPVNTVSIDKALELLRAFNLEEFIPFFNAEIMSKDNKNKNKDWETMSGGEKRRIALICAILKEPEILFMDEATRDMDEANILNAEVQLKRYLPKTSIVLIDHNASADFAHEQIHLAPLMTDKHPSDDLFASVQSPSQAASRPANLVF